MNELLKVVLSLSLSGTFLILLLFLLQSLCRERLSKRWQYYIWLVAVVRLLFPFAPETNLMTTFFQGIDRAAQQSDLLSPDARQSGIVDTTQADEMSAGQTDLHSERTDPTESSGDLTGNIVPTVWKNVWLIWPVTALILFIRKITVYQDFVKYIRAGCVEVANIDLLERFGKLVERKRINTAVELYTNTLISSPMLIGFFRPCIVLPTVDLPPEDFDYTILHELIHFKRRDMFYKWLIQFTVCVHWFNPFVYLMSKEIGRMCELSCDEAVIRKLDAQGRRAYGDTLLNAIGLGGSYKDSLVPLTLNESGELLKERLDAIMKFKEIPKWAILTSLFLTGMLVCGFRFLGAYTAHHGTSPNAGADTVALRTHSVDLIGFQQGEETTTKDVAINITEDDVKIQLNAAAEGNSHRTLEVIDPNGEVVRTYTFNQDGFIAGNQEYLYGKDMIMVTDAVYPGTWYVRLSTNQTPVEKTSVTARLIAPFVWGFVSDADESSAGNEVVSDADESSAESGDDSQLHDRVYDNYRTYEQTKEDIQNGYIVNTGVSFSEQAMPTVIGGRGTSFYVNHDNSIDISITLKNLIDGTGHHFWKPIADVSFVSLEVYDPSGKVAYSFYEEGEEIQNAVAIDTELAVYPGEWRYKINFAYTTNGTDPSDMRIALKYRTLYEDDMQWLMDNKLNKSD